MVCNLWRIPTKWIISAIQNQFHSKFEPSVTILRSNYCNNNEESLAQAFNLLQLADEGSAMIGTQKYSLTNRFWHGVPYSEFTRWTHNTKQPTCIILNHYGIQSSLRCGEILYRCDADTDDGEFNTHFELFETNYCVEHWIERQVYVVLAWHVDASIILLYTYCAVILAFLSSHRHTTKEPALSILVYAQCTEAKLSLIFFFFF